VLPTGWYHMAMFTLGYRKPLVATRYTLQK